MFAYSFQLLQLRLLYEDIPLLSHTLARTIAFFLFRKAPLNAAHVNTLAFAKKSGNISHMQITEMNSHLKNLDGKNAWHVTSRDI